MTTESLPTSSDKTSESPSSAERFAAALALIPELAQVEEIIRASFRSDVTPMREIPEYLLSLGGKRIRPALTLLCAKALGIKEISSDILNIAAGIELIHMATLMHDDIIDQSPIRRHKESPYAKFGTPLTLLSGDFLLTRAFGLCARLDDTIIAATEQACIELVEGEALETPLHHELHDLNSSLIIAQRKTASLFRLAAFCAGHLAGAPQTSLAGLSHFGESLGIAFQVIDDVLDVTSNEATLGKQPGLDIIERKPSVVNVLWLASEEPSSKRLLTRPIPGGEVAFAKDSLAMLQQSRFIEEAKRIAHSYGAQATTALRDALGENLNQAQSSSPNDRNLAAQALLAVVDFALERLR
jgi:octaprenyl-diphosphate synthase